MFAALKHGAVTMQKLILAWYALLSRTGYVVDSAARVMGVGREV